MMESQSIQQLVSIIIPAYNAERFLSETIESVINQTYTNWEMLIVNDGSTDATETIAKQYEEKDKRIRYIYQHNQGVSAARNNGFKISKGEYIAFLDADDVWNNTYIEKKVFFIRENTSVGMVVANIQSMDEVSQKLTQFYIGISSKTIDAVIEFYGNYSTSPSNIFCKRNVIEKMGGFNPALSNTADKLFYIEVSRITNIAIINEILVYYRLHSNNMHSNIDLTHKDYSTFLAVLSQKNLFKNQQQQNQCFYNTYKILTINLLCKKRIFKGIIDLFKLIIAYPKWIIKDIVDFKRIRKMIFYLLYHIGIGHFLLYINRCQYKIPILLFHRISPEEDAMWPPLAPSAFETIIKFIATKYSFTSLESFFSDDICKLKRSCVVVFDDGFEDFYLYAMPILRKYNVPVTIFISAYNIIHQEAIWTSQIDNSVANTSEQMIQLNVGDKTFKWSLRSVKERIYAVNKLKKLLISLSYNESIKMVDRIKQNLKYNKLLDFKLMNQAQIKELKEVNFQSHSYSHAYLPAMKNKSILTRELLYSKTILEEYLSKEVHFLAYPIGGYNERVQQEAKEYYKAAFAVDDKLVNLKNLQQVEYKYQIPRFNIHYANPYEVFLRINGIAKLFGR